MPNKDKGFINWAKNEVTRPKDVFDRLKYIMWDTALTFGPPVLALQMNQSELTRGLVWPLLGVAALAHTSFWYNIVQMGIKVADDLNSSH